MPRKSTLVLLCGLLSDERVWHDVLHYLDIKSIDVMIIRFVDEDTPQKMIDKILDDAPRKFALAGHSMGEQIRERNYLRGGR